MCEIVHTVLDVVGDVPDLLNPVFGLFIVGGTGYGGAGTPERGHHL